MVYFLSVTGCNIILKKFAKRMIWTWKWWMQWFITSIAYFEFTYNNGKYPLSKWGNMYILQNIDKACTTNNLAKYYKMLNPEFLKCESVSLAENAKYLNLCSGVSKCLSLYIFIVLELFHSNGSDLGKVDKQVSLTF